MASSRGSLIPIVLQFVVQLQEATVLGNGVTSPCVVTANADCGLADCGWADSRNTERPLILVPLDPEFHILSLHTAIT